MPKLVDTLLQGGQSWQPLKEVMRMSAIAWLQKLIPRNPQHHQKPYKTLQSTRTPWNRLIRRLTQAPWKCTTTIQVSAVGPLGAELLNHEQMADSLLAQNGNTIVQHWQKCWEAAIKEGDLAVITAAL